MPTTRSIYKTAPELIEAFLEQPLPKEIYPLSRFQKVDAPWGPPPHGSGPEQYAVAWTYGYDGGPIRGAFRWLGQFGVDSSLELLPKSLLRHGRAPKRALIETFEQLPEVERVVKHILRHGAALHDIQELLFGFQEVWNELDCTRPDTWAVEEMIEVLGVRSARGRAIDAVPASMVFLWISSDEPYHGHQIDRTERLLTHALREVMPGAHLRG